MKHTESFIENRIRWRAKLHGIPKKDTYFWGTENRKNPNIVFSRNIGSPVLVSESDAENFVIICTLGLLVSHAGDISTFYYGQIEEVRDLKLKPDEKKQDLSRLIVSLKGGEKLQIPTELGGAAFGVWNILIMLERMS